MAEPFTIYKLTILNMLDKVDFPLTNTQISDFFLEQRTLPRLCTEQEQRADYCWRNILLQLTAAYRDQSIGRGASEDAKAVKTTKAIKKKRHSASCFSDKQTT